jgi:uncharacterized protein involved in exopolysaccharide biosynthesis
MNPTPDFAASPRQVVSMLRDNPRRWVIPTVVLAALAGVYAAVRPDTWEASQALVVRNEATADRGAPGRFNESDEMKTVQETIQELVHGRAVLEAVLTDVGRPSDSRTEPEAWPSPKDIAKLRRNVALSPPRGAEFGATEVFYLTVRDKSRGRSVQLVEATCRHLERRYQQLRNQKAQSMIDELVKAGNMARNDLLESTARLTRIEEHVGADLAELRVLHDASSGDSALRLTMNEIRNELRQTQSDEESSRQLLALLREAQLDSDRLVATPSRLLEAQPALSRLKDGLVDARLQTAGLEGRMANSHPLVLAAKESEEAIAQHLHNELATAVRGIEVDLRLSRERSAMLDEQLAGVTGRLSRLASIRADYSTQVAETRNRTELLERAEQRLSEARISQASATTSLISSIDSAEASINPIGPSRAVIVLVGIVGGLMTGIGILLLSVQPAQPAAARSLGSTANAPPSNPSSSVGSLGRKSHSSEDSLSLTEALDKLVRNRALWN